MQAVPRYLHLDCLQTLNFKQAIPSFAGHCDRRGSVPELAVCNCIQSCETVGVGKSVGVGKIGPTRLKLVAPFAGHGDCKGSGPDPAVCKMAHRWTRLMSLAAFMGGVVALHYFPQHRYLSGENKETECWACLGVFERGLEEYMGPF